MMNYLTSSFGLFLACFVVKETSRWNIYYLLFFLIYFVKNSILSGFMWIRLSICAHALSASPVTVTLITHRHTPPLSHAVILHNSNSAFIPVPLFSPDLLPSLLQLARVSYSLLFRLVRHAEPFLSTFHCLSFTCPNVYPFTVCMPISPSAILTFSPTHAKREKDDHEGVCRPTEASNCASASFSQLRWWNWRQVTDWWRTPPN